MMAKWSHKYAVEIGPTWISQLVENSEGKLPGNLFFKQFDQVLMVNTRRNIGTLVYMYVQQTISKKMNA